jgi:prevent-host-death family protein
MESQVWQVATAKNRFSELLNRAESEGPQRVSRRGRTFVLLTEEELERMRARPAKMSFGEFLASGPSFEGVDLSRDRSLPRAIDLGADE